MARSSGQGGERPSRTAADNDRPAPTLSTDAPASAPDGEPYALPSGEPMVIEDIRDALVIRERSTFLLTDFMGNAGEGNSQGHGIYHADTRHLSTYRFSLNGVEPVLLLSTAELGYSMEQVLTNPKLVSKGDPTIERGRFEIRRQRTIADVVEEVLQVTNFDTRPITLHMRYDFDADFADIFDVRGYERRRHGTLHEPVVGERSILYRYTGVDSRERRTEIVFDRKPDKLERHSALFHLRLEPRDTISLRFVVALEGREADVSDAGRFDRVAAEHRLWRSACTEIRTDNEFFNRVLDRSLADVRMLLSKDETGAQIPVAGTPWFDALFGRDSCIVSMQMLAYAPELARATLLQLARLQGNKLDPAHDEEPGKILHELRLDELSRAGELPYGPYFGTVDATPLFLLLATEYFAWTADTRFMRELLPAIKLALHWLDIYGDPLDNGYLSYEKHSANGLVNQGWKDSWDAIAHEDGSLATPPIALAEAQAYSYGARVRLAPILERIGEPDLAASLRAGAQRLRQNFNRDFWSEPRDLYAMALDGEGHQVASLSTNPAHGMWTGLLDPLRAASVARHMLSADLFSGWGVRTLEQRNPRFNPIGYHVGSVWPHDNSIVAMGLKMYGFEDEANTIASALFDTAVAFPYFRLPELFGGDERSQHQSPVPYPVACRPQAWAAGAMPLITQAILGLKPEASNHCLRIVNPKLPSWLNWVQVNGLRIGSGTVSLQFRRQGRSTSVEVQKTTGNVDVIVSKRWPLEPLPLS